MYVRGIILVHYIGTLSLRCLFLTRFKQKNGYLSKIKIDKVLCFVCHVRTEVTANDTMPCGVVFFVKFLLDVSSNVLLIDDHSKKKSNEQLH